MKDLIIIKLGGVAAKKLNQDITEALKKWQQNGKQLIIVHGGGYAIDELMAMRRLEIEKIKGLRVTPAQAMSCVEKGLREIVGPKLTKMLNQAGLEALQINQHLERILEADYLDQSTYGYVGDVVKVKQDYLMRILGEGLIPVIPSLGTTEADELLNINADDLASHLAVALQAEQLILMTDVSGVKEDDTVLSELTPADVDAKIAGGVITGNMIPKVRGAAKAVLAGVGRVCIGQDLQGGTQILSGA